MGRCCGRSSGGCWVPASVLLGRKRVLGNPALFWTAACAAVTRGAVQRSLDCRLRGNDTCWIPACAGITLWPPHPATLDGWPPSPAGGEAFWPPLCVIPTKVGIHLFLAGFLLSQESHCGPLTRRCLRHRRPLPRWGEAYWTAACAGMTRGVGAKKPGLPLARE